MISFVSSAGAWCFGTSSFGCALQQLLDEKKLIVPDGGAGIEMQQKQTQFWMKTQRQRHRWEFPRIRSPIWRSLYEGSQQSGSILGAPDF